MSNKIDSLYFDFSYLRVGFSHAYSFFDPQAVIFLGDLFDEGVEASAQEILLTNTRFEDIFYVPESKASDNALSVRIARISNF